MQLTQEQINQEIKDRAKHQEMLVDLRAVLSTPYGKKFIKYLLESLSVGELPEIGLEGLLLHERLGFHRAGQSVFDIVSEANAQIAGQLISEIQREKYEAIYQEYLSRQGK